MVIEIKDKFFVDWFNRYFGHGYGTGEEYIIKALKQFFNDLADERTYDYRDLEVTFGKLSCWLLIEILCQADIIEYGTSPRFGFISSKGEWLKAYLKDKTWEKLYEMVCRIDENYAYCSPGYCNCVEPCANPLF